MLSCKNLKEIQLAIRNSDVQKPQQLEIEARCKQKQGWSVKEAISQRGRSYSLPALDRAVLGCLISEERMAKH